MNTSLTLQKASHERDRLAREFSFSVGKLFRHGSTTFSILKKEGCHYVLQNVASFETKFIEVNRLHDLYLSNAVVPIDHKPAYETDPNALILRESIAEIPAHFIDLSPAALKHGLTIIHYVKCLRDLGYTSLRRTPLLEIDYKRLQDKAALEEKTKDLLRLSLDTIYRWSIEIDKANGDWRAAFPNYAHRGGSGGSRINTFAVEELHKVWADLRRNTKAKISFADIHKDILHRLIQRHGEHLGLHGVPSRSTVERLTKKEFGAYAICIRNKGKARADKLFRHWYPRDRASTPLQVVEFDDKDSRVFLIDETTGLAYGRGYLTAGVDQFSGAPLGLSISDHPRSTLSALDAFRRTILPKSSSSIDFELLDSPPEFFGVPSVAIFDNALYNHSSAMEAAVHESTSSICAWAKPYAPTEKSVVEDFNGWLATDLFPTMPGYAGPKGLVPRRGDREVSAAIGLLDFKKQLNKWSYDIYCNTPRAEGLTPRQLWHNAQRDIEPRLPGNLQNFDCVFALEHTVRLRPSGVTYAQLSYQNSALLKLQKQFGERASVTFRYHPHDLTKIYVLHPLSKKYFVVESTMPEYTASLTLKQHKWILKIARDRGFKNPSLQQLLVAREELKKLTAQTRYSSKRKERQWAKHMSGSDNESRQSSPQPVLTKDEVGELEYVTDQITLIEIPSEEDDLWDLPEDF